MNMNTALNNKSNSKNTRKLEENTKYISLIILKNALSGYRMASKCCPAWLNLKSNAEPHAVMRVKISG